MVGGEKWAGARRGEPDLGMTLLRCTLGERRKVFLQVGLQFGQTLIAMVGGLIEDHFPMPAAVVLTLRAQATEAAGIQGAKMF